MCVQYIGGCSVHRWVFSTSGGYHEYIGGDTMSTSRGYHEYIGGISWVHRGVFSTSEGYHEYIGGCSVHRRDTKSKSGGYHEYIGGCSVHRGDIMIRVGGYHEYIGGCSVHRGIPWVHWGDIMSTSGDVQYIGVFNRNWKDFMKLLPQMYHDIPPMYWTSPDVLMISPRCTEHPPMYSWYPPNVLMMSPRCTEHPPMYWTHIIQGDYVEFTQDTIYSDWCRLKYKNFHPSSTASKLKFIWIAQSTREELENILKFIHICCEFTWAKTFSLKLIRIKILQGKTLSTLFSVLVFIQISSFLLLLLTPKRNRRIGINFYPFPHLPG